MQKTMLALKGQGNAGKTSTLRLVYECFGGIVPSGDKAEILGTILYDGVRVGFASAGDKAKILKQSLKQLKDDRCVVIVCGVRIEEVFIRQGVWNYPCIEEVESFASEHGFNLKWIEKPKAGKIKPDQERANREMADQIVKEVKAAVAAYKIG